MSEREGSDVLGVREDRGSTQQPTPEVPGSRGGKASKHSAEVVASQDQYSAEDGIPSPFSRSRRRSKVLTGDLGKDHMAEFRSMRD